MKRAKNSLNNRVFSPIRRVLHPVDCHTVGISPEGSFKRVLVVIRGRCTAVGIGWNNIPAEIYADVQLDVGAHCSTHIS
jgi:hypothetical protein